MSPSHGTVTFRSGRRRGATHCSSGRQSALTRARLLWHLACADLLPAGVGRRIARLRAALGIGVAGRAQRRAAGASLARCSRIAAVAGAAAGPAQTRANTLAHDAAGLAAAVGFRRAVGADRRAAAPRAGARAFGGAIGGQALAEHREIAEPAHALRALLAHAGLRIRGVGTILVQARKQRRARRVVEAGLERVAARGLQAGSAGGAPIGHVRTRLTDRRRGALPACVGRARAPARSSGTCAAGAPARSSSARAGIRAGSAARSCATGPRVGLCSARERVESSRTRHEQHRDGQERCGGPPHSAMLHDGLQL